MAQLLLLGRNIAACVLIARSCGGPQETRPARMLSGKEASMDTRSTLLALLALMGLGVSTSFGQNWAADPELVKGDYTVTGRADGGHWVS